METAFQLPSVLNREESTKRVFSERWAAERPGRAWAGRGAHIKVCLHLSHLEKSYRAGPEGPGK